MLLQFILEQIYHMQWYQWHNRRLVVSPLLMYWRYHWLTLTINIITQPINCLKSICIITSLHLHSYMICICKLKLHRVFVLCPHQLFKKNGLVLIESSVCHGVEVGCVNPLMGMGILCGHTLKMKQQKMYHFMKLMFYEIKRYLEIYFCDINYNILKWALRMLHQKVIVSYIIQFSCKMISILCEVFIAQDMFKLSKWRVVI